MTIKEKPRAHLSVLRGTIYLCRVRNELLDFDREAPLVPRLNPRSHEEGEPDRRLLHSLDGIRNHETAGVALSETTIAERISGGCGGTRIVEQFRSPQHRTFVDIAHTDDLGLTGLEDPVEVTTRNDVPCRVLERVAVGRTFPSGVTTHMEPELGALLRIDYTEAKESLTMHRRTNEIVLEREETIRKRFRAGVRREIAFQHLGNQEPFPNLVLTFSGGIPVVVTVRPARDTDVLRVVRLAFELTHARELDAGLQVRPDHVGKVVDVRTKQYVDQHLKLFLFPVRPAPDLLEQDPATRPPPPSTHPSPP